MLNQGTYRSLRNLRNSVKSFSFKKVKFVLVSISTARNTTAFNSKTSVSLEPTALHGTSEQLSTTPPFRTFQDSSSEKEIGRTSWPLNMRSL